MTQPTSKLLNSPELVGSIAKCALLDIQGLLERLDLNITLPVDDLPDGLADTIQELAKLCAECDGTTPEAVIKDVYPSL